MQRFLRHLDFDYTQLAKAFMALMDIIQPWVLSVAHTEWSLGLTRINILMLGVVKDGVAIPLSIRLEYTLLELVEFLK